MDMYKFVDMLIHKMVKGIHTYIHFTVIRTHFLSLARSKLRLCSANHRPCHWSNLPCDWPSKAWAYSEQETENGPRSRRNPRSRCVWLTDLEPHPWYVRTSLGIDAAAEVTISKCNLWKSWTLELTSEFSHPHLTIFSRVWDAGCFFQDHASRRNAKLQKIYQYFVG